MLSTWPGTAHARGREGTIPVAVRGLAVAIVAGRGVPALAVDPAPSPAPAVAVSSNFAADIAAAKQLQRKGRSREAIALLAADYKIDPTNRDVAVAFAQIYSYSGDQ